MKNGEFRQMDVDVAARTISYALLGVAEKVSAFSSYDPRMPEREAMWQAVREMVDRFVLVKLPRAAKQGEVRVTGMNGARPRALTIGAAAAVLSLAGA